MPELAKFSFGPLDDLNENCLKLLNEKVNIASAYSIPSKISFCSKCLMPNTRPRLKFHDGVCQSCDYWGVKESLDWRDRYEEFSAICDQYRSSDGSYDVVVPSSGGKDSSYVALRLKNEFGMNPLTVTASPLVPTSEGQYCSFALQHQGLPNVTIGQDGLVDRYITRAASILMGDPFQSFIYRQVEQPVSIALKWGIGLIVDGENGEAEYGGVVNKESDIDHFSDEEIENFWKSGWPIERLLDLIPLQLHDRAIQQTSRSRDSGAVRRLFFSQYFFWNPMEHYYYVVENSEFRPRASANEMSWGKYASFDDAIDPMHYFFATLKFAMGRCVSDISHELKERRLQYDDGIHLLRRFVATSPTRDTLELFGKYVGMNSKQLKQLFERWCNADLWELVDDKLVRLFDLP